MKVINRLNLKIEKDRIILLIIGVVLSFLFIITSNFSAINREHDFILERARVLEVTFENVWEDVHIPNLEVGAQKVIIEVTSGQYQGEILEIEHTLSRFENYHIRAGQNILISISRFATNLNINDISVYGPVRSNALYIVITLVVIGIMLVGGYKGLYALLSLVFTFITIVYFLVNGIINGHSPIVFSILTSFLIISFTTLMMYGLQKQSYASISGAIVGLVIAGLLSFIIMRVSHVSGINLESVRHVMYNSPANINIRIQDLLFASLIIAITGAMIDTSFSISSTIFEFYKETTNNDLKKLYNYGMQIGRSILGANVITLILAFVGTSLVTLILIVLFGFTSLRIMNMDLVAIEIIQGLAAALGIIFGIPATAFFSALLCTRKGVNNYEKKIIN